MKKVYRLEFVFRVEKAQGASFWEQAEKTGLVCIRFKQCGNFGNFLSYVKEVEMPISRREIEKREIGDREISRQKLGIDKSRKKSGKNDDNFT